MEKTRHGGQLDISANSPAAADSESATHLLYNRLIVMFCLRHCIRNCRLLIYAESQYHKTAHIFPYPRDLIFDGLKIKVTFNQKLRGQKLCYALFTVSCSKDESQLFVQMFILFLNCLIWSFNRVINVQRFNAFMDFLRSGSQGGKLLRK